MKEHNKITKRDHSLRQIRRYLRSQEDKRRDVGNIHLLDSNYSLRKPGTIYNPGGAIISTTISDVDSIKAVGLTTIGPWTDIGTFSNVGGLNEGYYYKVDDDDQGLHATNGWKQVAGQDRIEISVWISGHTEDASGNDYDYIAVVYRLNDDVTPSNDELIILRYEPDDNELRLYPNYDDDADNYVALEIDNWEDADTWRFLTATIDYQNQQFTLIYDGEEGTYHDNSTVPPCIDNYCEIAFFSDLDNNNNGFHNFQHLYVGPIQSGSGGVASQPITHVIHTGPLQGEAVEYVKALRTWTNENINTFVAQPDTVRGLSVYVNNVNAFGDPTTGTVTINGVNADGDTIIEVVTVDVAAGTDHAYSTTKAFAEVTSYVVVDTGGNPADEYSIGISNTIGLANGPLTADADVIKVTRNNEDVLPANYTVDTANATVLMSADIVADDHLTIWYETPITCATTDALASDSVEDEDAFGQASAAGVADTWSRSDHTHGTPADPVPAHAALDTGIHGVGASTIDSVADRNTAITNHAALDTGIHGVGASTIDSVADRNTAISDHSDDTTDVHGIDDTEDLSIAVPFARMYRNAALTLPSGGGAPTLVAFDTDNFDASSITNTTTGVMTPGVAGYYFIKSAVRGLAAGVDKYYRIYIYVNGAIASRADGQSSFNTRLTLSISDLLYVGATDTVDIRVYHGLGANLTVETGSANTHFSIHRVF